MRSIRHFVNGQAFDGQSGRFGDVFDPNIGEVQAKVALASESDLDQAVQAALTAQVGWAATNPQRRARVMFEFKRLVEARMQELAELLSSEHGKVIADSKGDLQRGLEVVEFACGIPHATKGEYTEGAGPGIDVYSMRQPLGVVAGITPFNFPAMIPMWMFGIAIAVGNSFILKPSEKDPSVPVRLGELFMEAGAAAGQDVKGVLNVVHGDKVCVDAILHHPLIKAVSFVGSSDIASYVYSTGAAAGKRVQAMGGAKNHGIILPDADFDQATRDIIGAAYGSAGERCMALPVVVPVGAKTADTVRAKVLGEIETLKVGVSSDPAAQYGPVVSAVHRKKIEDYIALGVHEGAELVVDGRDFKLQGYEQGRAETLDEAIALPSKHQYGNGVAIFTRSGRAAREFAARVEVGMVGINVPIPVPVAYHTFGGWKRSAFGDTNQHGMEGVKFYTKVKTITARWPEGDVTDSAFVIPTMN